MRILHTFLIWLEFKLNSIEWKILQKLIKATQPKPKFKSGGILVERINFNEELKSEIIDISFNKNIRIK